MWNKGVWPLSGGVGCPGKAWSLSSAEGANDACAADRCLLRTRTEQYITGEIPCGEAATYIASTARLEAVLCDLSSFVSGI